eukprot:CAMPEP_0175956270 /NCGR_PEP_ID=MMETSP0108-20121206/32983_1 /TAXON_ID=195067 ORGANISM="Goniomonas pacifica, Strain CCMP1869" /NCGR_SAMPLE_ID=MMETSP0108 /ASSEMBLY_ACC=CAM_ASM_000204 /LENGTH=53 /DNA_ID=CAMNT_0017283263 /DNA_START=416 /DNA_END=577 /DNA_ORIENTATION=-
MAMPALILVLASENASIPAMANSAAIPKMASMEKNPLAMQNWVGILPPSCAGP